MAVEVGSIMRRSRRRTRAGSPAMRPDCWNARSRDGTPPWLPEQPGRLQDHSTMASTTGVLAAGAAFVMIRTGFTAVNASIPLHALLHVNDTDAVAASALYPFDRLTHDITPVLRDVDVSSIVSVPHPMCGCPLSAVLVGGARASILLLAVQGVKIGDAFSGCRTYQQIAS